MSLSSLIHFLLTHNELVIQWLIVAIIGMVTFLIGRSLFKKPKATLASTSAGRTSAGRTSAGSTPDVGAASRGDVSTEHIEELLNKILQKTEVWDQVAPSSSKTSTGGATPVNSGELESAKKELAQLKDELEAKEAELKAAKASAPAAAAAAASGGGGSNKEYLEKISELESKLAEYEVLEDDIADLSLYKEENARLKSEVERLKGGETFDDSSATIPEPDNSEDLVREFAEAVGKDANTTEPAGAPEPAAPEPAAPEPEEEVSPLAAESEEGEFKSNPLPDEEPVAPTNDDQARADDLFAELASSDLDTDKVVSELAEIEKMAVEATSEEALSEDLDPDKIAKEADELKS